MLGYRATGKDQGLERGPQPQGQRRHHDHDHGDEEGRRQTGRASRRRARGLGTGDMAPAPGAGVAGVTTGESVAHDWTGWSHLPTRKDNGETPGPNPRTQPPPWIPLDFRATMWRSHAPSIRPLPSWGAIGSAGMRMRRGGLTAPHA